jgi:hypothetical protein
MIDISAACQTYILSSQSELKSLFNALLYAHLFENNTNKKRLSEASLKIIESNFPEDYVLGCIKACFLKMDDNSKRDSLNKISNAYDETENTLARSELYIELLRLINHDIEIVVSKNSGYGSSGSCFVECLRLKNKEVFNELLKCKFNINAPNKDIAEGSHNMHETLFSQVISHCAKHTSNEFSIEFIINIFLASDYDKEDEANRYAINRLFRSLAGAKICSFHDLCYSDFINDSKYQNEKGYIENTIHSIYKGISSAVDLEKDLLERDHQKHSAEEDVAKFNKIKAILMQHKVNNEEYLKPFFDSETIYNQLTLIMKDLSKSISYNREKELVKKISNTFSFFEELLEVDNLICKDSKRLTVNLFKLSKNNFSSYMILHYLDKFSLEELAANATGIEQAKYIMDAYNTDPITMMTLIKKEGIKKQLMELISA